MSTMGRDNEAADDDVTGPVEKPTQVAMPRLDDGDEDGEATVMARIPDALLAESSRVDEPQAGLKQMFGRQSATPPPRPTMPSEVEGDALLDMLFDDAEDDGSKRRPAATMPNDPPPTAEVAAVPPPASRNAAARFVPPVPVAPQSKSPEETPDGEHSVDVAPTNDETELPLMEPDLDPGPDESEAEAGSFRPSLPSGIIPSRCPPPVPFEREEDASSTLLRSHQRDGWVARAQWLQAEAATLEDPAAHARALLVVSELYAMSGEDAMARPLADEARTLAPASPLAHRQVRGLLAREGDWAAALEVIDGEVRASLTPDARCHSSLFAAEISRICLSDEEGARKRVDQALRVVPTDPRAHVQRLCEALATAESNDGTPAPATRVRMPDLPELAILSAATHQVLAHRGLTPATALGKHAAARNTTPAGSSYEALLRVRASAAVADQPSLIAGLEALSTKPTLAGGAGWLASVLASVRKETRVRAVEALRPRIAGTHGALARRALAARAMELDDTALAAEVMATSAEEAFSAADRVALGSFLGAPRADFETWTQAMVADPDLGGIAAAVAAAVPIDGSPSYVVGTQASRSAVSLGRALAGSPGALPLRAAVGSFCTAAPTSAIGRVLTLELDTEEGSHARVATAISTWRDDSELECERLMAGALIAELAGESQQALDNLDRARALNPRGEAIVRASLVGRDAATSAKILGEHASALDAGSRAAILWTEVAARLAEAGADPLDVESTLHRANDADPQIAIASHLGAHSARTRGDREALREWVRGRREVSTDIIEQAHDLVREALLASDGDSSGAAALLETALRARPTDIVLREVYERLAPEPLHDRASWRMARAAETTGAESARLFLEAAFELERSGDLAGAASCVRHAMAAGENVLAPIAADRLALQGHGASELIETLMPRAREATTPIDRLEIYERLAELDERGRGDFASGLLWRRTILEETGGHLPTLRRLMTALISAGREEEMEPFALEIARALDGGESVAHAMLASRLRQRGGSWDDTREAVEIAYKNEPRTVWTLRQTAAHARARGNHTLAVEADRVLIERTNRPSEAATISLRAAESSIRAGQAEEAVAFLRHAIELVPGGIVPQIFLASVLEQTGEAAVAATVLEEVAATAMSDEERVRSLYRAAILWQDKASDAGRARQALERTAEIDPAFEDVFQRLQAIYVAEGARAELAALLKRRLDAVTDPGERVEMEVLRGRALADIGEAHAAKGALAAALDANPDHVEALAAFADVCAAEEDWSNAEHAWIRLARLLSDPERQAEVYFRLGELYDSHLPNAERAELSYQEILKRSPKDARARERLVRLYQRMGDPERAIEQQTLLINGAELPEIKCTRTTELARIFEATGDRKKSEATLLQARKTWPKDDNALGALARFYLRDDQPQAAGMLLDRAVADARRALGTGRFEPYLFSTIATVAELRNRHDAASVAKAAVAALEGKAATLEGAYSRAAHPALDEFLAPEVMSLAFRELLQKTGPLLDTAVPFDLGSVRASPLPPPLSAIGAEVRELAASYGMPNIAIHMSTALGSVCVPVSAHPPSLVLGQALATSTRADVRRFLVHRALKILETNAAALSRTAPIDLWPLLAGYLKAFSPTWTPQGIDLGKLTDFHGRMMRVMPESFDPQLGLLAAEVIGNIGNRASTLNTAINGWGNRAGLLAIGDLNVAIAGIAWAGGHTSAPPANGKERVTWIGRNAEARELIVFSVSDSYSDARTRLGLGI